MSKKVTKQHLDPKCVHMPTDKNTVVIHSTKSGDVYNVGFTIGVQYFNVAERDDKESADFMCDMLEEAFKKLTHIEVPKAYLTKSSIETYKEMHRPEIKIKNLH